MIRMKDGQVQLTLTMGDESKILRFLHYFHKNILRFAQIYVILPSKTKNILRNGC